MPRRDDDMIARASESEYLEPAQRARFDCMDALDKLVQPAAYDSGPRMQDRWMILHELTDAQNLDNPRAAVVRLEQILDVRSVPSLANVDRQVALGLITEAEGVQARSGDRFGRYLSAAIGALNKYAYALDRITAKTVAA